MVRCRRCKREGHTKRDCYAKTDAYGNWLDDDDDDDDDDDGYYDDDDDDGYHDDDDDESGGDYSVYVIRCSDGSVYVGETWHTIAHRFDQHRRGKKSGRFGGSKPVSIWWARCVRGLSDRNESERVEKDVARQLRREGYHVRGGH